MDSPSVELPGDIIAPAGRMIDTLHACGFRPTGGEDLAETSAPHEDLRRHLPHVIGTRERQADGQLLADDVQHQRDAGFAVRRERIKKRLADEATLGAERQRLEYVLPGSHAAVEQHFATARHGFDHFRQRRDGRARAVQLPTAVVGNHDRIGADLAGHPRILRIENALDDDLARPLLAQQLDVAIAHQVDPEPERALRRVGGWNFRQTSVWPMTYPTACCDARIRNQNFRLC